MNRYDRTEIPKYFNGNTYRAWRKDAKRLTKDELIEQDIVSKEDLDSITTPGQAITIKELNERYETGRPVPNE